MGCTVSNALEHTFQQGQLYLFSTAGAHPTSYLKGSQGSFPEGKVAGVCFSQQTSI